MIAARHSQITQNELREEREVESNVSHERSELAEFFRIHSPCDFRPPIVQPAHERRHHPANHDVMKMRDDEVGIGDVNIEAKRGEKKSSESADGKQPDEPERVEHR